MNNVWQTLGCFWLAASILGCGQEPAPPASPQPAPPAPAKAPPSFDCRTWQPLDGGTTASFRGLSAVSDDIVWVSGTGGTWGKTTDGGNTWMMHTVPGAEELDFRDVDAFDENTAYLMSAGPGDASRIYKTEDGGESWQLQYTNPSPEGFWDGMAFWNAERGALYGDPVGGRFVVLTTDDGGTTWSRVPEVGMPPSLEGEAGFAASGSGIAVAEDGHAWFGTGGPAARVFHSTNYGQTWAVEDTPMQAGEPSMGIFSLAVAETRDAVVVGGNYTEPESTAGNAARTLAGSKTWQAINGSPPAGYRSGVAFAPDTDGRILVAVGTSGSDFSLDGGETWTPLGTENFNAVSFGDSSCGVFAAGPEGRLARLHAGDSGG